MSEQEKLQHRLLLIGVLFLVSAFIITGLGFLKIYLHGKTLPASLLQDEKIAWLSENELEQKLAEEIKRIEKGPYRVKLNDSDKNFTAAQLGLFTDYETTKSNIKIFNAKRDGLTSLISSVLQDQRALELKINPDLAAQNIEKEFQLEDSKPQNARLSFNDKKELSIIPEKEGLLIDKAKLKQDIKKLVNKEIDFLEPKLVAVAPNLQADDLFSQKEEVAQKLKEKITFQYKNTSWSFKPMDHLNGIDFHQEQKVVLKDLQIELPISTDLIRANKELYEIHPEIEISFNDNINGFIESEVEPKIDKSMQKAKIYFDEKGKIIIEGTAENGLKVHKSRLKEMLAAAVNKGVKGFEVPVKLAKAEIEVAPELKEKGIQELIAVGHTTYYGSPANRRHNIWVGTNKFNGLLLERGEEFSFNENLGPVEAYTGYLPELVIKGDEGTIPEYGGGLCQVSSTLYRAALMAGVPITQRRPHSYAVSYYAQVLGYGLDATIYPGVSDVRFKNDTPGAILIQSYNEGSTLYFKFYGTDDGRKVEFEGPYISNRVQAPPTVYIESAELEEGKTEQKENSHAGFDTLWYRYLTKDGKTEKESIFSRYNAVPAKILVGIKKKET